MDPMVKDFDLSGINPFQSVYIFIMALSKPWQVSEMKNNIYQGNMFFPDCQMLMNAIQLDTYYTAVRVSHYKPKSKTVYTKAMYPSHRLLILVQIDSTLRPPVYLHPCQCAKITASLLKRLCSHKQESAHIFSINPLVIEAFQVEECTAKTRLNIHNILCILYTTYLHNLHPAAKSCQRSLCPFGTPLLCGVFVSFAPHFATILGMATALSFSHLETWREKPIRAEDAAKCQKRQCLTI